MYKLFFLFALSIFLSVTSVFALSLMDIANPENDTEIDRRHLPRYITTIFESRREYLEERVKHFESESRDLLHVGRTHLGDELVIDSSTSTRVEMRIKGLYLESYQDQLRFFQDDPFTMTVEGGGVVKLDLSKPGHLILFYRGTAHTLLTAYQRSRAGKEDLRTFSANYQLVMEPLLLDEESMIEDFADIIRAVRPHLPTDISNPFLKAGNQDLEWLGILDAANQWRDLSLQPESQATLRAHWRMGSEESEHTSPVLEEERPVVPEKRKASVSAPPQPREQEETPPMDRVSSPQPAAQRSAPKKKECREEVEQRRVKVKTRPSLIKQSLNHLFVREPAWQRAKRKFAQSQQSEGRAAAASAGAAQTSIILNLSRIKTL